MADNTQLSTNVGSGDVIRDKDRAGVKTQIVALDLNPAGSETLMAGAMPVTIGASVAVTGTFWQATQPVSLATVPSHDVTNAGTFAVQVTSLPSGLATSAKQDTGNTSLASIDGKVPALGQALAAASVPVVLTAAQLTTLTPPAAITGFATSAKQDTGNTSLASIDGKLPSLGQALAAASVPIVLTAAQLSTLTPPAAITGFATESTLSTLNGKVTACNTGAVTISAALPAGTNAIGKLAANSGVTIGAVEIAAAQTLATVTTVSTVTSLTQFGGVAITLNKGASDAGTLRATLGDGTQTIGALTANQSVNLAQVGGSSTATGHGTASGAIRVELPTDSTGVLAGVTTVTTVSAVTAITNALPAGTNAVGGTYAVGGKIIDENGNVLTVKRAAIAVASSGENTLVAAVTSKKIRVLSLCLVAAGAVNVYFDNATDGAIFGGSTNKITLDAGGAGFILDRNVDGWFQTGTVTEALRINLSGGVGVSGGLTYIEV